jgi:hypothetical protein
MHDHVECTYVIKSISLKKKKKKIETKRQRHNLGT